MAVTNPSKNPKRLPKGQRKHTRRLKQAARKGPIIKGMKQ